MSKKTILIVDDQKGFVQMLDDALSPRFDVVKAFDGFEGLEALTKFEPHLIILDINMPNMSGIEFYSRLTEGGKKPRIPTLIVTARTQLEELFKDFGVNGFMTKPFTMGDLFEKVDFIIAGSPDTPCNKKVLIGEDNDAQALAIQEAFTEAGFKAETRSDGWDIISRARENVPDLVLLKLALSDLGGDIIAAKLREMPHLTNSKIIIYVPAGELTLDPVIVRNLCRKSGVTDVLFTHRPLDLVRESSFIVNSRVS
jgi:DNA-binding response OmpR family regulator